MSEPRGSRGPEQRNGVVGATRGAVGGAITRLSDLVVPTVVRSVDLDEVLDQIDLDRVLADVDLDAVLARLDVSSILDRIDLNALLERIDVDALIGRIDVDAIVRRVDVDGLIQRVDVDGIVQRIDLDAVLGGIELEPILDRVDVHALAVKADIGNLVAESSRNAAVGTLDIVRRQCVGLDVITSRTAIRLTGRDPGEMPAGPPALVPAEPDAEEATEPPARRSVTGQYAAGASRLAAYATDSFVVVTLFGLMTAAAGYVARLVDRGSVEVSSGWFWTAMMVLWAFVYFFASWSVAGRTPGMFLFGVQVVRRDGAPLRPREAFLRVITLPLSFLLLGAGLVGIVIGRERRGLHDVIAGTVVVYHWGQERGAELPAPLSRWMDRRIAATSAADG